MNNCLSCGATLSLGASDCSRCGRPVTGKASRYALYRIGSIRHDPSALWLSYEWHSFENREWRPCVADFLGRLFKYGHSVTAVSFPPFTEGEDFVELVYLVDGVRTSFTSDLLLSLITIASEDPQVLGSVWKSIGDEVGWVDQ